jgi:protein phosphatase
MADHLSRLSPQAACDALVQLTLQRGAKDNVTVIVVRCTDKQAVQTGGPPKAASGGDEWHVDA